MSKRFYLFLLLVLSLHIGALFLKLSMEAEGEGEHVLNVHLQDAQDQKRQIVQSEDSERKEPRDDAYLSDKDRSFDRETRARQIDKFKKAAQGGKQQKKKKKEDLSLADLGEGNTHPLEKAAQEYSQNKNGLKNGDPNSEAQVSATNDHVEDVPLGDFTHLNSAEYKYYGFYHRIRQRLEQFWGRSIQEKAETLMKEGRRLPASDEIVTALRITLDSRGRILDMAVISASGVKELDDAAIEAFNQAGPFPNPPRGLLVNGRAVLEWGFVVQT